MTLLLIPSRTSSGLSLLVIRLNSSLHIRWRRVRMFTIVLIPGGLTTVDKYIKAEEVDWSTASEGYVKARSKEKEWTIPLSSIWYVESG